MQEMPETAKQEPQEMQEMQEMQLKSMKQEPKTETKPDYLLTFDEFLSSNAESKLIKEYSGFFFSTSKQAPRFNGKSLYHHSRTGKWAV